MTGWQAVLLALSLGLLALGWRYLRLRRGLDAYVRELRRFSSGETARLSAAADDPALLALDAAFHGVLRRLQTESARLDAERTRLSAVLEQIADGVLLVDAEGIVTYANAAANRLFGESGLLTGRSLAEALRHYQMTAAWRQALERGEMADVTVTLAREGRVLRFIAVPDQEVPGGALLLVQDITRLRQLETVRRNFIANFSHELRTPLAGIKALAETLQEGALEDPPAARRFLERIVAEVDALNQMAQELLDLTRIESGNLALEREAVSPAVLLQDAAGRMRLQVERAGLTLTIRAGENLPLVFVDPGRIGQALLNLVHNAIKFTPAGGQITLEADAKGGEVWLSVSDTGPGIPPDDLPHIFERFYKVDRARNTSGSGLGLAIVRHIVSAHGGRVWAESQPGMGSRFVIALPC